MKGPRLWVKMFQWVFAHAVETGKKRQTVRPRPKGKRPQAGDRISLRCWTDKPYRSKQRVLAEGVITAVHDVLIHQAGVDVFKDSGTDVKVVARDPDAFAKLDGFVSWAEMKAWFEKTHGLSFEGMLIEWELVAAEEEPTGEPHSESADHDERHSTVQAGQRPAHPADDD